MLHLDGRDLAAAIEQTGRTGAAIVRGALSPEAQGLLLAALESAHFERAPERVGKVRQDFDLLVVKPGLAPPASGLSPLLNLAEEYVALLRQMSAHEPWLVGFAPTDIHLQRYGSGSQGISLHRDSRRFIKLISVFSLGSAAVLQLFRNREGPPFARYKLDSGDLLLLRAPGFADRQSAGPLHSVTGPVEGTRYSMTLRMEQPPASAGL